MTVLPAFTTELQDRFVDALLEWMPHALVDVAPGDPQARVDRDGALLDDVLAGRRPAPLLRVWTNETCVVVTNRLARHWDLAAAATRCAAPVVVRRSGGTAVVHRPGVLNVSLVRFDDEASHPMDAAYRALITLLGHAARAVGVETSHGAALGSFCDGAYNLLWRGRKLAGTAAVVRRAGERAARLVHASLTIDGDLDADLAMVAQAEEALRQSAPYMRAAHVTLAQACAA